MPFGDSPSPFFDPKPGWGSRHVVAGRFRFDSPADGPREIDLKSVLIPVIKNVFRISVAYLVWIQIVNEKHKTLALCLKTLYPDDDEDAKLTEKIFDIYAPLYDKPAHMDLIYLTSEQETMVLKVCKPFFERKDRMDKPTKRA